jgi:TolA-binding protein
VKLAGLVVQAGDIAKRQSSLVAEKQEVSKQLRAVINEIRRLSTVIRLSLKEHYGIRSEKLAEFGVQPFRGRNRNAKAKKQAEQAPARPAEAA